MKLRFIRCPRCLNRVDPWPIVRPDNCGMGAHRAGGTCIRDYGAVCANWRRLTPEKRRAIARKLRRAHAA